MNFWNSKNIKWYNLYPNIFMIIYYKKIEIKMSNFWNVCLSDYNQDKRQSDNIYDDGKWRNYPEIIYLFSVLNRPFSA